MPSSSCSIQSLHRQTGRVGGTHRRRLLDHVQAAQKSRPPTLGPVSRRNRPLGPVSLGLVAGVALDAALGDPQRHHPVAVFGSTALALERRLYRSSRRAGARHLLACLAVVGVPAVALGLRRSSPARSTPTAFATWAVVGGRSLGRAATDV